VPTPVNNHSQFHTQSGNTYANLLSHMVCEWLDKISYKTLYQCMLAVHTGH